MIQLSFSPSVRVPGSDSALSVESEGHVLTLNGEVLDLSFMVDGDYIPLEAVSGPGSDWLRGPIEMIGDTITLKVYLPIGDKATEWARFPTPITLSDGVLEFPPMEVEDAD